MELMPRIIFPDTFTLFTYSPNKYKLPMQYICINKLLHVCNILIAFICVPRTPAIVKTEPFATLVKG